MHTHTLTPTLQRVMHCRGRLLLDQPFFGVLALRLQLLEDEQCDTAWTDGRSIGFSPAFVATLTDDQLIGLIVHEVMHCACGHPWRRDARDHEQWNIAADHAINHVITSAGMTLPDGALLDPAFVGRNAEWIYDRLPSPQNRSQQPNGNGQGNGQGQQPNASHGQPHGNASGSGTGSSAPIPGEVRDAPADCASDGNTDADWQEATAQAARVGRGSLPGSAREALTAASEVSVDWRSLLQRYLTDVAASDYTWTRPSARYLASGLYLPSLRTPDMGELVIAIDTSASIDTVLLRQFMTEIAECARVIQPRTVHVMQCDTRVHKHDCFDRGDAIDIGDVYGRGGTDFAPVFDAIDACGINPAVCVYLTDLDGPMPDHAPAYPVVWCVYGSGRHARNQGVPFGDVIPCE